MSNLKVIFVSFFDAEALITVVSYLFETFFGVFLTERSTVFEKVFDCDTYGLYYRGLNKPTLCLLGEYAATNLEFILKVEPTGGASCSFEPAKETAVEFIGLKTVQGEP